MATKYPPEEIFEIEWTGPYTFDDLKEEGEDFTNTLSLYAKYSDHPLYGRKVLTYIGKAVKQTVLKRLSQHDLGNETIYVGAVYAFKSWKKSQENWDKPYDEQEYIRHNKGDGDIISRIEELLIYSLMPAENTRNKSTAKNSWGYRIFNTGDTGDLPTEVSGHYALENTPKPQTET